MIGAPPLKITTGYWVSLEAEPMTYIGEGKTIPVQASTGPEGSRSLRLQLFMTNGS
jgi:hypothetical protein